MAPVYDTSTFPPPDRQERARVHDEKLAESFLRVARTATQRALEKTHAPTVQRRLEQAQAWLAFADIRQRLDAPPADSAEGR